jgi:hypothetical protein
VEGIGDDVGEGRGGGLMLVARRIVVMIGSSVVGSDAVAGIAESVMVTVVVVLRSGIGDGSGHFGVIAVIRNSEAVARGQHVCERATSAAEIWLLKNRKTEKLN